MPFTLIPHLLEDEALGAVLLRSTLTGSYAGVHEQTKPSKLKQLETQAFLGQVKGDLLMVMSFRHTDVLGVGFTLN